MKSETDTLLETASLVQLLSPQNVYPFYLAAGVWMTAGVSLTADPRWFLALAIAACLDLFLLLKVVATVLVFVSHRGRSREAISSANVAFWFAAKLVGFGILLVVLLVSKNASFQASLMGVGTFAAVPLMGGLFWSRKNLRPESSSYAR